MARSKRARKQQSTIHMTGRVYSPPSVPPTIAAPRPLKTWVEFFLDVGESPKVYTTNVIAAALQKQYGYNPESATATSSFAFVLHKVSVWMIPQGNDVSYGELTIQFIDSPASGAAVIRQVKGYGSGQRAPRVGFQYPTAIQQLPVQSNANFSWVRVHHDTRTTGDQSTLFRVLVSVYFFGSDV